VKCEDRPLLDCEIPADEWNRGVPDGFDDITEETSLVVRIALMNNYEQSEGMAREETLRRTGLRQFKCPICKRLHWEIERANPNAP
jgi:hypothetical protein